MKKQALIVALLATIGFAGAAQAADGTVKFTGELTDVTCSVQNGTGPQNEIDVTLPTLSVTALTGAGEVAGATGFNIKVGGPGCTEGQRVSVHFESASPAIDAASGNLNIAKGAGQATNVQVQIADANNSNAPINLFTNTNSNPLQISGGSVVLPFTAQYVATGAATPGAVSTEVQYSISYN